MYFLKYYYYKGALDDDVAAESSLITAIGLG